ncbi:MAG: FkbM family methyltransferase [Bacteroidetes bacterium]|nr:FkbM family methyltransferase [Bacteroidota bacterium]
MSNKILTYIRYFQDYAKYKEYGIFFTAIGYQLFKRPLKKSGEYTSSLGKFYVRKGTIDFQFANYAYEWEVKQFFLKHYKEYSVFLDIGANIGIYSILMAQKGLICHAFEPMPENYQAMLTNISLNNLEDNIRSHNYALGCEDCSSEFIFEKVNTGASRLATQVSEYKGPKNSKEIINLKIFRLDAITAGLGILHDEKILIKMDAEGMEDMILLGAIEFLKSHRNILLVMEKKHQSIDRLNELLALTGEYECLPVDKYNVAYRKKS